MTTSTPTGYFFHKFPTTSLPEASGYGIQVIPGFGQWALIHPTASSPPGAIPVEDVVAFLEKHK